jgi:hypothetical protein
MCASFDRFALKTHPKLQEVSMIPEAKKEAVARALRDAFGVSEFEDIRMLTAGLSPALVFRIVVKGRPYLLRIVVTTGATLGPGRGDQTNHYACMRMGADAGVGPRVWYASTEDRVSITDFVEARPFKRTEALARLPLTIRTLHALPPFSYPRSVNYLDSMDKLVRRFLAARILPPREEEELLQGYERVAGVYPRDGSDMVSSHNDMKPENVLFDGEQVWLVDWEAGFLNDRYVDLAVVANFVVTNEAEEEAYLRTYFGEDPVEYRRARFQLMQQLLHMFYSAVLLMFSRGSKSIDLSESAPSFRAFHDGIWAGEISLATDEAKLHYARVHLNQFLQTLGTARYREALRIVSERHAGV